MHALHTSQAEIPSGAGVSVCLVMAALQTSCAQTCSVLHVTCSGVAAMDHCLNPLLHLHERLAECASKCMQLVVPVATFLK